MRRFIIIALIVLALAFLDLAILPYFLVDRPDNVAALSVAKSTYNTATLTWDKAPNATKYIIYRAEEGKDYSKVATVRKPTFKDKNLTTGTTYKYKVKAGNFFKGSEKNATASVTPQIEKTPKVEAALRTGKVEITVKKVPGAFGYMIFRNDEKIKNIILDDNEDPDAAWAGDNTVIVEDDAVTYIDEDAKTGERQVYKALAYSGKSESYSKEVNLTIIPAGTMTAKISDTDPGKVVVSWDSDGNYKKFKLFDGEKKLLAETEGNNYSFDLKEGTYTFRLIGYDGEMESPPQVTEFRIDKVPMDNELARQAACDWAVQIANDNSFNYGTKGPANHSGCYFCGTQGYKQKIAKRKGIHRSFAKTYCCVTFVTAAFAHGAKDPYIYDKCSHRRTLEWLVGCNHISKCGKRDGYQNFRYLGHIPRGQLIPGDVLSSNNHVKIYIGDGLEAEATGGGWSSRSIRVEGLEYQGKFKVFRYVGSGSGDTYKITSREGSHNNDAAKMDQLK